MNQVNCSICGKGNWKNYLQPDTNKYCEMLDLEIMPAEYSKNPVNMFKEKREYEQSFKDYILNDARMCLSYAGSLEHFIFLMKRMGYEFKGKDYLSVKIPGMKLYHRLDKLDDIFSKEELPMILKYGYGQYYRKYQKKYSVCKTCEPDTNAEEVLCQDVSSGIDRKEMLSVSFCVAGKGDKANAVFAGTVSFYL